MIIYIRCWYECRTYCQADISTPTVQTGSALSAECRQFQTIAPVLSPPSEKRKQTPVPGTTVGPTSFFSFAKDILLSWCLPYVLRFTGAGSPARKAVSSAALRKPWDSPLSHISIIIISQYKQDVKHILVISHNYFIFLTTNLFIRLFSSPFAL